MTAPARQRSTGGLVADTLAFPVRAVGMIGGEGRLGLSSLQNDRYREVARRTQGHTLDVGCGPDNRFVADWLDGNGVGIDVFAYPGLKPVQIVSDLRSFPFEDGRFDSVTFIACLNHVPEDARDDELRESHRVLRPGGNVVITMGNPAAEFLVHKVLEVYGRLGSSWDVDSQRGMVEGESYYVRDEEIRERLSRAGFTGVRRSRFATQWGLNHLFAAWKA